MFLRTRLHMYLLWATVVFALAAVISSFFAGGGGSASPSSTTVASRGSTTSTASPAATGPMRTYVVQPGDSLFGIAQKFNLSAPALVEVNKIKNPDRVPVGTSLLLPPSMGFVPIGATTTMPP